MRALLYDIHGNVAALDAVLGDAASAGADSFVLGGDYALFGARPVETVELLGELDAEWIRGNGERWTADPASAPELDLVQRAIVDCRSRLGVRTIEELAALRETAEFEDILFCHASPRSDLETFGPQASSSDGALLSGTRQSTVVFGHSHLQFDRTGAGRRLVNPGSVGMPFDGDRRAAYALWHDGEEIELRRVEYDHEAYIADIRQQLSESLGGAVETLVRRIEQARFVD
jgi:diadenosine tetraphosphatase ApaH/serine/threonine PP2A family protein phosphatase